jgi:cellulose synthase/poly-beta-1,6-N-acetylglucosamine synthase-like glycosyltransferase
MIVWWAAGVLIALFWAGRLRDARGIRSVPDITAPEWEKYPHPGQNRARVGHPRVLIIVPARNEEESVERCLRSLLALDYPDFSIIAVDDRSTDRTGAIMDRVAQSANRAALEVLHIRELPSGWLGKPHAMWMATEAVTSRQAPVTGERPGLPEWFLFTDADVEFRPDALRRAVACGEAEGADHIVLFPTYQLHGIGEKIMLAGFQLLFVFGHRPWKAADPRAADFMGLGPFNLIRRGAYEKIGGFRALRMEVIEDMKLGKLVKQHGLAQRNVFGPGLLPWRWSRGALGLSRVLTKNMFALMQFRWARALGACALLLIVNLLPVAGTVFAPGWARAPFLAALGCIALMHIGMSRRTPAPWWTFLFYPISTVLMVATMLRSMLHVLRHGGVVWRGTRYNIAELRKGMV